MMAIKVSRLAESSPIHGAEIVAARPHATNGVKAYRLLLLYLVSRNPFCVDILYVRQDVIFTSRLHYLTSIKSSFNDLIIEG